MHALRSCVCAVCRVVWFDACARVPGRDACGWRGSASRAFSGMGASGACHVDMWGGWCGNVRVGCMRCVAVRRVAMGARAVVPLRCVVVLVTPSRHGCHGVRGRELIVSLVCVYIDSFVFVAVFVIFVCQGLACPSGQFGPGGQTSQALATCSVRRAVAAWQCTDPVVAEGWPCAARVTWVCACVDHVCVCMVGRVSMCVCAGGGRRPRL